jgi:hypothetical protein
MSNRICLGLAATLLMLGAVNVSAQSLTSTFPLVLPPAGVASQPAGRTAVADGASTSVASRYTAMAVGMVAASTWNQVVGMPEAWPRTWRGYGYRMSDQVGFAVIEESLKAGIGRVVPWRRFDPPCEGARRGSAFVARSRRAMTCGVQGTLLAVNANGQRRPNVPLLGAIAGASAASLAWRPERASAGKGQLFVASRIGIVLAGTVANRAWESWRGR